MKIYLKILLLRKLFGDYKICWGFIFGDLFWNFSTLEIIWRLIAVKFAGDLYLGIDQGILLLGKLFGINL